MVNKEVVTSSRPLMVRFSLPLFYCLPITLPTPLSVKNSFPEYPLTMFHSLDLSSCCLLSISLLLDLIKIWFLLLQVKKLFRHLLS